MIKSQLIEKLVEKFPDLSEKQVVEATNRIVDVIAEALIEEQRIEIRGFGSFSLRYRPRRANAHNPKTGEKVITEEKYAPHFKPGKELRERVNASRERIALIKEK